MFEQIELLKRQWTDRYVAVDGSRPELRRFEGLTGTVRTVNMNGRALVEFDGHANIGWYDIELPFLTMLDAPLPKLSAEEKAKAKGAAQGAAPKAAAKPAGGKPSSSAIASSGKAAGPKASGPRPGVAEILALARAQGAMKGGGTVAKTATPSEVIPVDAPEETTEEPVQAAPAKGATKGGEDKPSSDAAKSKNLPPMPDSGDTAGKLAWCRAVDGNG